MKKFVLLIISLTVVNSENFNLQQFFSVKDPQPKSKTTRSAQKCTVNMHPCQPKR